MSAVCLQYKTCHYFPAVSWFIELQETKWPRRELEEGQLEYSQESVQSLPNKSPFLP